MMVPVPAACPSTTPGTSARRMNVKNEGAELQCSSPCLRGPWPTTDPARVDFGPDDRSILLAADRDGHPAHADAEEHLSPRQIEGASSGGAVHHGLVMAWRGATLERSTSGWSLWRGAGRERRMIGAEGPRA